MGRRRRTPILDLVYLTHQCQGDTRLEDQLLLQFRLQTPPLCAQLSSLSSTALEAKGFIAHKLRGSALAVGALRVADAAGLLESEIGDALEPTPAKVMRVSQAIAKLEAAVAEAIARIDRDLG